MTIYLSINLFSTAGSWCSTLCVRSATGQPPSCKSGPSAGWIRHANLPSLKSGIKIRQVASVMQIHQVGSVMQMSHANQVQVQVDFVSQIRMLFQSCFRYHANSAGCILCPSCKYAKQDRLVASSCRSATNACRLKWRYEAGCVLKLLLGKR